MTLLQIRNVESAVAEQFRSYCAAHGIKQAKVFAKAFLAFQKAHPDP